MIATTINLHHDTFQIISRAANQIHTSKREIIVRLLMRVMRHIEKHQGGFTSVCHQAVDTHKRWHCFSIRLKPDENEFFIDLRKICKCSVSYLVAIAARKYLDELINDVYMNVYYSNYTIHRREVDGIVCWQMYWGITTDRLQQLLE